MDKHIFAFYILLRKILQVLWEILYGINDFNTFYCTEKKSESLYEDAFGGPTEEIGKTHTIFEGLTRKGDCCNLPKCIIF